MRKTRSEERGIFMNLLTLLFFIFIVAVLSAAIIAVNSSEESGNYTVVVNIIVGICLTASVLFLPFGKGSPKTLFGRAINALSPDKPAPIQVAEKPVTTSEPVDDEEEEEISDFVVYECDDYYIKMSRDDHVMEIVPSEERLKDALATERLAYYDFSGEFELDGHTLNVYAARLAEDTGFVCIVLYEEYHQGETNPGFTENDNLFRLYDEDNGYMYGFAYEYDYITGLNYFIGDKTVSFKGMYEALKLDKKYFEVDE